MFPASTGDEWREGSRRRISVGAIALLAAIGLGWGTARAESLSPCASFEDPFAFNACLARRGVAAGSLPSPTGSPVEHARIRAGEAVRPVSLWDYYRARNRSGPLPSRRRSGSKNAPGEKRS